MELGPFALISAFYLLLGLRLVVQLAQNFRQTFDRNFTHADRMLVDQAAFFILLPIAVALHELGHAVAIWLFGGEVLDWGFYGFAGYVAFDPSQFTAAQRILIAAAGTIVNLILAGLAVAVVFLKRPPLRAAFNELLIQFTWISLLNALVLYPLLDVASGLNGDWTQMYDGGVPALSLVILAVHLAVLALLFWAWRSPRVRARIAQLTDDRSPRQQPVRAQQRPASATNGQVESTLREAAARVASGWPVPLDAAIQHSGAATALVLSWGDPSLRRSVLAVGRASGGIELVGLVRAEGASDVQRPLGGDPHPTNVDRLTLMLRLAMETVDGWTPGGDNTAPGSSPRILTSAD
jgi:hypothetical protein